MALTRIVFMGTPELACASLEALANCAEFEVVAVVTQPDRPKGRELKLQPSPIKRLAQEKNLPVLQPERARAPDFFEALRGFQPDLIAVTAFGQILPQRVLDLPQFGCLNVHTSLLPKYRGAAPIQWAILNDEPETGVTIMRMDAGLDTGPILSQERTPIRADDNSETLHDRLATLGSDLLVRTILDYITGKVSPIPQPSSGASHAPRIKKQDGQIDWTRPARALWNQVRGLTPWPGAFTSLPAESQGQPQLLKIWQAAVVARCGNPGEILQADKTGLLVGCGAQALQILVLQREGGRRLTPQEFLTGHALKPGQKLR